MRRSQLPDAGAYITVHTRSGLSFTGFVDQGHMWANGVEEVPLLCLAQGPRGGAIDNDSGENLWQYVQVSEIVAFAWDCRP